MASLDPRWTWPTSEANRALACSHSIARADGRDEITTSDLLDALRSEPSSRSAMMLESCGWPPRPVVGAEASADELLPFDPEVQRVMQAAKGVARRCGQAFLGSEHLLLALAEESEVVAQALDGVALDHLLDAAERVCGWANVPRYSPLAHDALFAAEEEASAAGRDTALVADLVIALADGPGAVAAILVGAGVSAEALRDGLAEHVPPRGRSVRNVSYSDIFIRALYLADQCRSDLGHDCITPEHLLLGALALRHKWVDPTLAQAGTSASALRLLLPDVVPGSIRARTPFWEAFDPASHQVLLHATQAAAAVGARELGEIGVLTTALSVAPAWLARDLTSLGVSIERLDLPPGRTAGCEACPPLSDELRAALSAAWRVSRDQMTWRASPTHLLFGLLREGNGAVAAWLKNRGIDGREVFYTVARAAVHDSWTDEARHVWRAASAVGRDLGATQLSVRHVLLALIAEPPFREQRILPMYGITVRGLDKLPPSTAARADADSSRDLLPLGEECERLHDGAVAEAAKYPTQVRVARSHLVRALAFTELETVASLGVDRVALGEHLDAPRSMWAAYANLARVTRELAELTAIYGPSHTRVIQAMERRARARRAVEDRREPPRERAGRWRRSRSRLLAARRAVGDAVRTVSPWHFARLQSDGAFALGWSSGHHLTEFADLLVRYDKAIAEAESGGSDWSLAEALLNRADTLDALGRQSEARADRERVRKVIAEDDDASSHLWLRAQTSLAEIHADLARGPVELSRAERREANRAVLGARAYTIFDFVFPSMGRDLDLRESTHAVGLLLPRTDMAVLLVRAGDVRQAIRELRRIVRARRRLHLSRHPQTIGAEVVLAHGLLVAALHPGLSTVRRRCRLARARRTIRRLSNLHARWLEPGHPLRLRTAVLQVEALRGSGRAREALDVAVDAIALADAARYRFDDTRTREGWRGLYASLMKHALSLAQENGDERLAVELIEAARSQGEPIETALPAGVRTVPTAQRYESPGSQNVDREGLSAGLALIADVPVAQTGHVSVSGEGSRLDATDLNESKDREPSTDIEALTSLMDDFGADAERASSGPEAVDLISLARDITGHPAPWIWGSWDVDDVVVSYLVRPSGRRSDAVIDVFTQPRTVAGEPTPLGEALTAFRKAMMTADERATSDAGVDGYITRSDLTRWVGSERQLLADLGLLLIPEPLRREAAHRAAQEEDPIPLVVMPAPSCASLPLAALAVALPAARRLPGQRCDAPA